MKSDALERVIYRYPQLILLPEKGLSQKEEYQRIVRKGILPKDYPNRFTGSEWDELTAFDTPVGSVDVLYLYERQDFEQAVRILSYKGEPVDIPPSMGAITTKGIINWRKIEAYRQQYELAGGTDWKTEFKIFTSKAERYRDTLVIVSEGAYSAVPGEMIDIEEKKWLKISRIIRTWHELTHVYCGKQYPEHRHAIRDELIADCIGLTKAFGYYDKELAKTFLGIEENQYRPGGRLENYLTDSETPEMLFQETCKRIDLLEAFCETVTTEPWQRAALIEENNIGFLENENMGRSKKER